MAEIQLRGVTKRYPDGTEAVKQVDLDIGDGEFMILVGPSGCGKSTALRMIAGLEDISDGELVIGGGVIQQVDSPAVLYDDPANLFVAGFIGSPAMNFLPGRLEGDSVRLPFGSARLSDTLRRRLEAAPGGHPGSMGLIVGIPPGQFEDASIESKPDSLRFRT